MKIEFKVYSNLCRIILGLLTIILVSSYAYGGQTVSVSANFSTPNLSGETGDRYRICVIYKAKGCNGMFPPYGKILGPSPTFNDGICGYKYQSGQSISGAKYTFGTNTSDRKVYVIFMQYYIEHVLGQKSFLGTYCYHKDGYSVKDGNEINVNSNDATSCGKVGGNL